MENVAFSVVCGLILMFSLGIANAMIKSITQNIGVNEFLFVRESFVSIFLILLFIFNLRLQIFPYNLNVSHMIFAFLVAIIGYFALNYLYKSYNLTKVGLASPISSFNVVIAICLSVIFLGLRLNIYQVVGVSIIIFGVLLVKFEPKSLAVKLHKNDIRGINFAFLSSILMGAFLFLIQIPTKVLGPILTPIMSEANGVLVAKIFMLKNNQTISFPTKKALIQTLGACLLIAIASVALYYGLSKGNAGIILALYSANPVVVTVYGAIFYNERLHLKQYFAIFFLILGVVIIRFFSS